MQHIPELACNEFGTPLLNDLFEKAQKLAKYDLVCYVNADIILMNDFMKAIERVRNWRNHFLLTGMRWNVDISGVLDFSQPEWESSFRDLVHKTGGLLTTQGLIGFDYFVFTRNLFRDILPLAVGRGHHDTCLLWQARAQKVPVVDATDVVMAVHQNHDYSLKGMEGVGLWGILKGEEAQKNLEITDGGNLVRRTPDTTHRLTRVGVQLDVAGYFHLRDKWIAIWFFILKLTRPCRHALGLNALNLQRLKTLFERSKKRKI